MSLKAGLCCFFLNDTSEWLKGPTGAERTRNLSEALVVRPEEVERFLKDNHVLSSTVGSLSMHILEATFVVKKRVKLT